ncbi:MAG: DNA recombination protein RmuC [Paracoccaceae bacterium]|jgi:DNA recombination protein RmuC
MTEMTLSPLLLFLILTLTIFVVAALYLSLRAKAKSITSNDPIIDNLNLFGEKIQKLSEGQERLTGGLQTVSEAQAKAQLSLINMMEERLSKVQLQMNENLSHSSRRTAQSLGDLQQRLATIDKAQEKITKLSGDVLSLQDILSNKQTRGAFGEIQLTDIVSKALPSDGFDLQATLSNGRRADCLIKLPNPPGPIIIDSKFPLEAYEALRNASSEVETSAAVRLFKTSVRKHIKDISERYIIEGETADGAILFLPSEAVYAELHANYSEIVREGFSARVWIVSPTTCMATLNTMRAILKDARMREQAGAIRKELTSLYQDVDRLGVRVESLDRHFNQAAKDISDIKISADKAGRRAKRLDNFDFEEISNEDFEKVIKLDEVK